MTDNEEPNTDDETIVLDEYEVVAAPPTLTPAYAITGRVGREKHPDFPDEETVTLLDLYVEIIMGPDDDETIQNAILPIIMTNDLADHLGLKPESEDQ